jgi:hypothetical protein
LKKRREGMEKSMKGHIYTLKTDSRAKRRSWLGGISKHQTVITNKHLLACGVILEIWRTIHYRRQHH